MKLSEKIVKLRKTNGWSQEDLAEKLDVSRQAVSRWEGETAQPDAANILQLSKLFRVTTDYLLYDEYESDNDLPKLKEVKNDGLQQNMILLVTLEVMTLLFQFITAVVLQNTVFTVLGFIPFAAAIGGFEYAYQKKAGEADETARAFRKRFYAISAWLGAYFPVRLAVTALSHLYPRPYSSIAFNCVILAIYLLTATLITLRLKKNPKKK